MREALQKRPDGSAFLPVEPGVVRADGQVPSQAEATALAVLALEDDKEAPLANLGTSLLADYRLELGWGMGAPTSWASRRRWRSSRSHCRPR